jgi:hypothetical protein
MACDFEIAISDDEAQANENTEFRKTQLLSKQVERYTLVAWPPINAKLALGSGGRGTTEQ